MEAALDTQIGEIHRNLKLLISQWTVAVTAKKKKPGAGGIRARIRQHLETKHDYDQLSVPISHSVNRLRQDWKFIDLLVNCISKSNGPCAVKESLVQKSKGVADAILMEVYSRVYRNQSLSYYLRPKENLKLLGECQRKTDKLWDLEIRGALAKFTVEGKVRDVVAHFRNFNLLLPLLAKNLQFIIKDAGGGTVGGNLDIVRSELLGMRSYLNAVFSSVLGNNDAVSAFLTRAEFLVLRIAFQSCNLWFNCYRINHDSARVASAAILDLHREIQPSNLEFLRLALGCQQYLYRIDPRTASVAQFCRYVLLQTHGDDLVCKEMNSLVTLYFGSTLKNDGEDVQRLFAEILAVLGDCAFFFRSVKLEAAVYALSLSKIFLLKAELFLKQQSFGDISKTSLSEMYTILRTLRKYIRRNLFIEKSLQLGKEIYSLQISLHFKEIDSTMVKYSLLQLLFKIVFFKSESFLVDLLNSSDDNISITPHERDQINSIIENLAYFKRVVTSKLARDSSTEEIIITQVEATLRDITLLSYSCLTVHERFFKIRDSLPQVLDKANIVKEKLREIEQQFPKLIFPKINQLGFIGRNISDLLKHNSWSIAPVKHHIQEVLPHLESLRSFVTNVKDVLNVEVGDLNDLGNEIIVEAYKLEYVVQTIEADGHLQQSLWLYDRLEDIRCLHERVSKIPDMPYTRNRIPSPMSPNTTNAVINEKLIDLIDEEEAIVQRLTRGSAQQDIVSIVGMAGIGKTTLARKVYNNLTVTYYFHRRAWCTVSQTYSKRDLFLEIMSHMPFLTDEISQLTEDGLLHKLRQCLLGNKYLIVMDDVWDTPVWDDLSHCFPDNNNGSRILITSRFQDVASRIKPGCHPHFISLFSDAQSWMLLQNKIFGGAVCPQELIKIGVEIAQNCQGLPLAVVTIAGLLQRIERSEESWKAVVRSFSSEIIENPENMCRKILELSYKHLPEHLKACFLYLGVFLENKDIPAKKLMRYWMAEGLIAETESKSLEEVADEYLLELINRSLVNISKRRSNGKVRTCGLHDLLRDLCQLKAKEENFLQAVTINDEPYSSYLDSDYELEFDSMNDPVTFQSYRLSLCLKRQHFIDSRPLGLGVQSLIFFASMDMEPKCPFDISFICHNFKLLRLLDLEHIMTSHFPAEIGLMIQLRYLAVSGYMQSIPPSIANLWRLETLIVKGLRGKVLLPETIWKMVALKHLHVNNHVAFSMNGLNEQQLGSSCVLQNLISFSTPSLSCGENTLSILSRLPNLKKLRCNLVHSKHCSEECKGFPAMEFLARLESLKIIHRGRGRYSREFIRMPSNIKKLTLSNFSLLENHLSMIAELPNLKVLKLLVAYFVELTWVMKEDEFMELTFLELDSVNIVEWNASYEHLPSLQQLVLRNCKDLTAIPSDFASITTLKSIEVQWCGQSVVESAQQIQDAEEDIEVLIN